MTAIAVAVPTLAPDEDRAEPIQRKLSTNWAPRRPSRRPGRPGEHPRHHARVIATAITESISMGVVGYTSMMADRDYYLAVRQCELQAIHTAPQAGREEIRRIYAAKGFADQLLDKIVDTLTSRRDRWLTTGTDDVLHLRPVGDHDALRSSVVITAATLIGHLIPLMPFLWLARTPAVVLATALSALVLFGVGVYSATSLVGDWRRSGLKMIVIGLGAAAIGSVFHCTP